MQVCVIRHGESETNLDQKWTGWLDVHLTDKGRKDAARAGEFLRSLSIDKIYTSDLVRAIETAEIAIPGGGYETSPLLREINVGSLSGQSLKILTEEQRRDITTHGYVEFGGETQDAFYSRIRQFQKMLETLDCETVALFSHRGWLRGMLNIVMGMYLPSKRLCCRNCTIAIFEYTMETWKLHSWINLS